MSRTTHEYLSFTLIALNLSPSPFLCLPLNSFVKIVGANIVRRVSGSRLGFRFGDVGSLRLWIVGNTRATVIGGSFSSIPFSFGFSTLRLLTQQLQNILLLPSIASTSTLPRAVSRRSWSLRECISHSPGISRGWIPRGEFFLANVTGLATPIFI